MLPSAPLGDCQYQPSKFAAPANEKEVQECKDICSRCPVFRECEEWAYTIIRDYNKGRQKSGLRPRVNLAGVIAGNHFRPTDGRGRPINEELVYEDFDTVFGDDDFTGYTSGYEEHMRNTRLRIEGRRANYLSEPHTNTRG